MILRGGRFFRGVYPWKLKPGFINRVLVEVIFEASNAFRNSGFGASKLASAKTPLLKPYYRLHGLWMFARIVVFGGAFMAFWGGYGFGLSEGCWFCLFAAVWGWLGCWWGEGEAVWVMRRLSF